MVATADGAAPFEQIDLTKVSGGAATLYLAPVGTAMPADTVNMGVSWGVSVPAWVPIGSTTDGVHIAFTPNTVDWMIEESPIPAAVVVDSLDVAITATLEEDVIANLRYAIGLGTIATQAAGVGAVGKSTLTLNTLMNQFAVGIEHGNAFGHWTRYSIPTAMGSGGVTVDMRRSQSPRQYALSLRAVCLPSQITITQKTAESTG